MKKIGLSLLIILIVALVFVLGPLTAQAAPGDFTIVDGVLTNYTGAGGDIVIPSTVVAIGASVFQNDLTITGVTMQSGLEEIKSNAFYGCTNLTFVTFPGTLTRLYERSFKDCISLTSVVLPNSLTQLDGGGFYGCTNLTSIKFSKALTYIGDYAFYTCNSLTTVDLKSTKVETIEQSVFEQCANLVSVSLPKTLRTLGDYSFYLCSSLEEITLQNGIYEIGNNAFYQCANLLSFIMPDSVTTLGEQVFRNCINLETVKLSKNITSIPRYSFDNCGEIEEIDIPEGVTDIGDNAFIGCAKLKTANLPDSLDEIGYHAFYSCDKLTNLVFPENITTIRAHSFAYCNSIISLVIPSNITTVETGSFSGCSSLKSIVIKEGVTTIETNAFLGNAQLKSVKLPSTLTSIGASAFSYCHNLESIEIPSGVTTLSTNMFYNTYLLKDVSLPNTLTTIEEGTFANTDIEYIVVPSSVTTIGNTAFDGCDKLERAYLPSSTCAFGTDVFNGVHASFKIHCYSGSQPDTYASGEGIPVVHLDDFTIVDGVLTDYTGSATDVTVPEMVHEIADYAFYGNDTILNVIVPMSVTKIGDSVFESCDNLISVLIHDSVTEIGDSVFYGCFNLASIDLPSGLSRIGQNTFRECDSLTSVAVPEGITSIEDYAFYGCSDLTTLYLPESLKSIGMGTFKKCDDLTDLSIPNATSSLGDEFIASCESLTQINVGSLNENYRSIDGVLFNKAGINLIQYPIGNSAISYDIPYGVKEIEIWAFADAVNLQTVNFPDTLKIIGPAAFMNCVNLDSLNLPSGLTQLDAGAFSSCTSITEVTIPSGVKDIGASAFDECNNLTNITLNNNLETIGDAAFLYTGISTITIPASVEDIASTSFLYCVDLEEFDVVHLNPNYMSADGVLFNKSGDLLVDYPAGRTPTSYTVPESVKEIGDYGFAGVHQLTDLDLSTTTEKVGERAFEYASNLANLKVFEKMTEFEGNADNTFLDCKATVDISCYNTSYAHTYAVSNSISFTLMSHPEGVRMTGVEKQYVDEGSGIDLFASVTDGITDPHPNGECKFRYSLNGGDTYFDISPDWHSAATVNFSPTSEGDYIFNVMGRLSTAPGTEYLYDSVETPVYLGAEPIEDLEVTTDEYIYLTGDDNVDILIKPTFAAGYSDAEYRVSYSTDQSNWTVLTLTGATGGPIWYEFLDRGDGKEEVHLNLPISTKDIKYYIKVDIRTEGRDVNGAETTDITTMLDNPFEIYQIAPLKSVSFTPLDNPTIYEGTPIILDAFAMPDSRYAYNQEYRFAYRLKGATKWTYVSKNFSDSETIDFIPKVEGTYEFNVEARNEGRITVDVMGKMGAVEIQFGNIPVENVRVRTDGKAVFKPDELVPLIINTDSDEDLEYQIMYSTNGKSYKRGTSWKSLSVDTKNNAYVYYDLPTTKKDTHYYLKANIRAKGRTVVDAFDICEINVYPIMKLARVELDLSGVVVPLDSLGGGVELEALAEAKLDYTADFNPEYRFSYRMHGSPKWVYIYSKFTTETTAFFKPKVEGTYYFKVEARSIGRKTTDVKDVSYEPQQLYYDKMPVKAMFDLHPGQKEYTNGDSPDITFNIIKNDLDEEVEAQIMYSQNGKSYKLLPGHDWALISINPSGESTMSVDLPIVLKDTIYHVKVNARTVGRTGVDVFNITQIEMFPYTPVDEVTLGAVGDGTDAQLIGTGVTLRAQAKRESVNADDAFYRFSYQREGSSKWLYVSSKYDSEKEINFLPSKGGRYKFKVEAMAGGRTKADIIEEGTAYSGLYFGLLPAANIVLTKGSPKYEQGQDIALKFTIEKNAWGDDVEYQIMYSTNGKRYKPLTGYSWGEDALGVGVSRSLLFQLPAVTKDTHYWVKAGARTVGRTTEDVSGVYELDVYPIMPIDELTLTSPNPSPWDMQVSPNIVLNAQAKIDGSNADADYRFYYRLAGATKWKYIDKNYSTTKTKIYTALDEGLYEFKVEAKGVGRKKADISTELSSPIDVYDGIMKAGSTILMDLTGTKYENGDMINLNFKIAENSDGDDTEYQVAYSTNGKTFKVILGQDWGDNPLGGAIAGNIDVRLPDVKKDTKYWVRFNVRSIGRSGTDVYAETSVMYYKILPLETLTFDMVDPSGLNIDGGIRMFASAGSALNAEYRFAYKMVGKSKWSFVSSKFTSLADGTSMVIFYPKAKAEGDYNFKVEARAKGRAKPDLSEIHGTTFNVYFDHQSIKDAELEFVSGEGHYEYGDMVSVMADATVPEGETAELQIVYSTDNRKWQVYPGYDWQRLSSSVADDIPIELAYGNDDKTYYIKANFRTEGRTDVNVSKTVKLMYYSIVPVKEVTLSAVTAMGDLVAELTTSYDDYDGYTSKPLYKFYYRLVGAKTWIPFTSYIDEEQTTFVPTITGNYEFRVEIKNSGRNGYDAFDVETNAGTGYYIEFVEDLVIPFEVPQIEVPVEPTEPELEPEPEPAPSIEPLPETSEEPQQSEQPVPSEEPLAS